MNPASISPTQPALAVPGQACDAPAPVADWQLIRQEYADKPMLLGLERIRHCWQLLGAPRAPVVITVGGTNGKGSACAMLESIYRSAGYKVGRYTSPHLLSFHERISLNGQLATDQQLDDAYRQVVALPAAATLTQFELDTLAALLLMAAAQVEVAVLEVGLGGRLDAVNIIDADAALITSIDLDHTAILGNSRDQIAAEKAAIYRSHTPAICSDPDPLSTLVDYAQQIGADFYCIAKDFGFVYQQARATSWQFWFRKQQKSPEISAASAASEASDSTAQTAKTAKLAESAESGKSDKSGKLETSETSEKSENSESSSAANTTIMRRDFALPTLKGTHQFHNTSGVLAVVECLQHKLAVPLHAIRNGLATVQLMGRFQLIPGQPVEIYDVAHNPQSARSLANNLSDMGYHPRTFAVVGMLADKDIAATLAMLLPSVSVWHLADLPPPRGATAQQLLSAMKTVLPTDAPALIVNCYQNIEQALTEARKNAHENDRIVVFGSFVTVAAALKMPRQDSQPTSMAPGNTNS